MKTKNLVLTVLSFVLGAVLAIGGTLAYLTDRESKANVFTVGDVEIELKEDFDQGATLTPGVNIEKKPTITNTGKNDAWVWLEFAIPSALDNWATDTQQGSNENVIHWNQLGATTEGYVTDTRVAKAIADGHLAEGTTAATINEAKSTWNLGGKTEFSRQEEIDGIMYNVYVIGYNKTLTPGETTLPNIYNVFLDSRVDITPDGDWYIVENGNTTKINWNSNDNAYPVIYVNAYAMQNEGFANVDEAIRAYGKQWGNNGTEYAAPMDFWDGTIDTDWYNDTDTEFVITTAEQLAGFGKLVDEGKTFEGKTVKLGKNIDLKYIPEGSTDPKSFDPIGYGYNTVFKGTFDGQGFTISNLYQNGWALGLDYSTEGGGLFASVVDATIKNLTIDNAEIVMECIDMGIVAGYSYGNCAYENITITNSTISNYNRYTGGVVGEVNGTQTFKNVDIDSSCSVNTLWGSFDTSLGGIVGGKWGDATLTFEDCDVACQIDSYNDITATPSRQWHAYRRAGMLIGNSEESSSNNDGISVATASYLTAKNCTVTYGVWANYSYCEFNNMSTDWPHCRVQAGSDKAYRNARYGVANDLNGNMVVNDNHVHADGEDHNLLIEFDQLFGGDVGVYGTATHEGVTVVYNNK